MTVGFNERYRFRKSCFRSANTLLIDLHYTRVTRDDPKFFNTKKKAIRGWTFWTIIGIKLRTRVTNFYINDSHINNVVLKRQ